MSNNHSQWNRYGWPAFALVVVGLSFVGLSAGANSFRPPSAPQLVLSTELRNPLTTALELLKPSPTSSTASFTSPLPATMQQPAGCGASFAQALGSPVNAGTNPRSVAVGDFNLDGKPDLAVANETSNNVTILLGNGSGGFIQPIGSPITVGTAPRSVAGGDFNLDGKPDLAVANTRSNTVTVLLGNGNGGFGQSAGSPVSVGSFPRFVTVGDFNLDGKPDLAIANSVAIVSIRMGDGLGGFTAPVTPIGAGTGPEFIAVGDFNLDGKPDFAVADRFTDRVRFFRGLGNGLFIQALGWQASVGGSPSSLVFGDFNQDGKPDIAVANAASNNVLVLLGDGTGIFSIAAGSPINVGTTPLSIAAADFNFDGKLDLAVANDGSNNVTILQGNGSGGFSNAAGSPVSAGTHPSSLAIGDFNLDGKPDFATANLNSNNVTVQLNTCPAQPCSGIAFSQPLSSPVGVGVGPVSSVSEDFNLDGKPDLAIANLFSADVTVLLGDGIGGFIPAIGSPFLTEQAPRSIVSGDFNRDGKPDIAVANSGSDSITILIGNGSGGFTQATGSPLNNVAQFPFFLAVSDFNLDGKLDLCVVSRYFPASLTILLGDGNGGFIPTGNSPIIMPSGPSSPVVSDINLDGKPDLAVAISSPPSVRILLGDGNGGFTQVTGFQFGTEGFASIATEDFNLDGKPDLALIRPGNDTAIILLGNGSGNFTQATNSPISTGVAPNFLTVGELNGDGKPDIIITHQVTNQVTILLGDGNGVFTQPTGSLLTIISEPRYASVCDFNLDGKHDLAVLNNQSSDVVILLNTCLPPNTPPTINCSTSLAVGNDTGQNSASVPFNVTATGIPSPTVTCRVGNTVITSPHVFPVGTTTVTCTASNGVAPDAACSFTVTVNRVSGSANDPLACTGPGSKVQATLNISNNGQVNQNVVSNTTFTNLIGVPGSCSVTPNVGNCTVTATGVNYSATLTPAMTVTITYLTQVSDLAPPLAQVCTNNSVSFNGGAPLNFSACDVVDCPAVGPGGVFPSSAEMSDQKAGSVLVYNIYTSSTDPNRQNTRINLTNAHSRLAAFVHLFFVFEGCSIADSYVCLTANQTTSFLTSDLDPGVTGFVVAVAVDSRGCPIDFNYLLGDEFVKFASGHAANLSAQAFAALPGGLPACDGNSVTAAINFDGVSYNRAPRVLALSNVASRADGNDTMLILNRIGGNLGTGAASLGTLFGILYDDAENALSFQVSNACQLRSSLSNSFPRTAPRFETFIPAGRSGWLKVFSQSPTDIGITGAAINFNPNVASSAGAFNQGHNLHALTMSATNTYTIPVFPPSC